MNRSEWSELEWAVLIEEEVQTRLADEVHVPNYPLVENAVGGVIDAHFRRGDFNQSLLLSLRDMKEEIASRVLDDLYPLWDSPFRSGDTEIEH